MKIGDTFWIFDVNRRVYDKNRKGYSGGPIYSEHFAKVEVIGETTRSWIFGHRGSSFELFKDPKNKPGSNTRYFTDEEKSDQVWLDDNRMAIIRQVERLGANDMRKVARLIGYEPSTG